jgi:AcrR family transcriptional regulator
MNVQSSQDDQVSQMNPVDDKRTAILEATLKLVSERGFHGTAMSKVAREAGVSAGIIYHYFEGKDDLINELYKSIKRQAAQAMLEDVDLAQSVRSQIRQLLGNVLRHFIQRPRESAFLEQYARSPYYGPQIETELSQHYQPVVECFQRAQQDKVIKDLPQVVISAFTLDVATSLAQKHAAGLLKLTDDLIDRIVDASWEAIKQ